MSDYREGVLALVGRGVDRDDVRRGELFHPRAALEQHALLDHERRRGDVAVDLRRTTKLDGLRRLDVPGDLALDDDRPAADLRLDLGALADLKQVVRGDLAGERSVDPDLALERELALELGALPKKRVELTVRRRVVARVSLLH